MLEIWDLSIVCGCGYAGILGSIKAYKVQGLQWLGKLITIMCLLWFS